MGLELLGLDAATVAVYRAVLAHPDGDDERLGRLAGTSAEQARDALERLVALGLASWEGPQGALHLHDPDAALSALLARQQSEVARKQLEVEQSRVAVGRLLASQSIAGRGPDADVERLDGIDAVRDRLERLSRACREEVWSFNPGGAQSAANLARSRPLNEQTLARGVRMRAVYLDSVRNDPASREHAEWLVQQGAEVRSVPELPVRMLVVDRATAVIPVDERDSAHGALVLTGRGVVAGLAALFLATWRTARPLGPRPARARTRPSVQETQALRLWAQGATDTAVARALGVSERTVRRMSETLAERLGARSRFETGVRAVAAGWLTPQDLD